MSAPTRDQVLSLYRSCLRTSRSFASYNFRNYFIGHTKHAFRQLAFEKDPQKASALFNDSLKELAVLRSAAVVNRLYEGPKLVVERERLGDRTIGGGGAGMEASVGGGGQPVEPKLA